MGRAAWRDGRGTTLLLVVLMGCGADSFELESGGDVAHGQADTTQEPNDAVANVDDTSSGGADLHSLQPDIPIEGPTETPIVLPPQAVYDLPAVDTLTDRPHWRWVATQPTLSQSRFMPSDDHAAPSMELNVAGVYVFELHAWKEAEALSEIVWTQTIYVVSEAAIHVELLWDTPSDPDQTDEGIEDGADLDLHFAHLKYAKNGGHDGDGDGEDDPWFHQPFDAFWFTPNPNWGTLDPEVDDDPSLDRDDTDGAGPENLNLTYGQDGAQYAIGVHYWSDHEFGESTATVRIYVDGLLLEERSQAMKNLDMWYVGHIDWPGGVFTANVDSEGANHITPLYQSPKFSE